MGEINADYKLGASIIRLVKKFNLKTNLEIGSWDGSGSTKCFIEGMKDFPEKSLTCLEIVKEKYDKLVKSVKKYPWIKCYNKSSVDCSKLIEFDFERMWKSPFNPIHRFDDGDADEVQTWYNTDVDLMKQNPKGFLEKNKTIYDAVLIDGSEFTGFFEFELLRHRTNVFFLDDSFKSYKTTKVNIFLSEDIEWDCLADEKSVEGIDWGIGPDYSPDQVPEDIVRKMKEHRDSVRNGFAIFKRKVFIKHER